MSAQQTALILGVTGQLGSLVANELHKSEFVRTRVTSRRENELSELRAKYGDARYIDLDDPRTFAQAFEGVHSLFMLTGYTVNMLVQSKALVDAAKKAGVKHIVHVGVFSQDEDCYDPHFAWHQFVEAYIKVSEIPYTFLHPNCFMQNFTGFYGIAKNGRLRSYMSGKAVGWIALEDVAEAAAKILIEGEKHFGKDYWFSTEAADLSTVATIFSDATGRIFVAEDKTPEHFLKDLGKEKDAADPYFIGVEQSFVQLADGRMAYLADVRDDMPLLTGRRGLSLKDWALLHKEELLA
jgi:NAD(P)H dehydrogenase (quinone)